jgi:hypothetical protein
MASNIHKGSGLSNVSETWDANEQKRAMSNTPDNDDTALTQTTDLDRVIKEEAAAYDNEVKENQLLGGDRASVNDDEDTTDAGA